MLDTRLNGPSPAFWATNRPPLSLPQPVVGGHHTPDRFEPQAGPTGQLRFGGVRSSVTTFQKLVTESATDSTRIPALRREFRMTLLPKAFETYEAAMVEMNKDRARGGDATMDHDYGPFNYIDEWGALYGLAKRLRATPEEARIKAYYTDMVMTQMDDLYTMSTRVDLLHKMATYDAETAQAAMLNQLDKSIDKRGDGLPHFAMVGFVVEQMADIARMAAPSGDETPVEARIRDLALAQHRTVLGQPNKGGELARRLNDAAAFLGYTECEALVNQYVAEMQAIYKADARKIDAQDVSALRAVCYRYGFDDAQAQLDAMKNAGLAERVRTADKLALIEKGAPTPVVRPTVRPEMASMVSVVDLPTMHIQQKNVGDCVLLATIDAIQRNKREGLNIIANLAKLQPDGSWIVTFHDNTQPIHVKPTDTHGEGYSSFFLLRWAQKLVGYRKKAVVAPDVVRVIERAYGRRIKAQQQTVANTMDVLDRGVTVVHDGAMRAMIGPRATYQTFSRGLALQSDYVARALSYIQENPEYTIAWCGTPSPGDASHYVGAAQKLIGSHAYAIVDVTDREVVLANPHDNQKLLTLTHDEFAGGVSMIYTARLPRREK